MKGEASCTSTASAVAMQELLAGALPEASNFKGSGLVGVGSPRVKGLGPNSSP